VVVRVPSTIALNAVLWLNLPGPRKFLKFLTLANARWNSYLLDTL
jgi:hypothetical protein